MICITLGTKIIHILRKKEMIENVSGFDVRFIHTIGNFIDISSRYDSLIVPRERLIQLILFVFLFVVISKIK